MALLLLGACQREPKWKRVDVHERDGWRVGVPRDYVPYAANVEQLKTRAPGFAELLSHDGGVLDGRLESFYVLTTRDLGCSLGFTHRKAPGLCERFARVVSRLGETRAVSLPNGEWTSQISAGSQGGTIYSWELCRDDELWTVTSSTLPDCHDEAKAREAELLQRIGAAQLTPR